MKKVLLDQISVFGVHGKTKKPHIKIIVSAPTWNDEFELPYGSYFISDIQEYYEYKKTKWKH